MLKNFSLTILLFSSLFATEPTEAELNSIYQEAVLFVIVFGTMGIISYIYSKKHAKAYVAPKVEKKTKTQQELKDERVDELLTLYKKDILTRDEFDVLKEYIYHSS